MQTDTPNSYNKDAPNVENYYKFFINKYLEQSFILQPHADRGRDEYHQSWTMLALIESINRLSNATLEEKNRVHRELPGDQGRSNGFKLPLDKSAESVLLPE